MMLIFESDNFVIVTPENPHVSRSDGGHLIVNPKVAVEDRTKLSREKAIELMKLTMVAVAAMKPEILISRLAVSVALAVMALTCAAVELTGHARSNRRVAPL